MALIQGTGNMATIQGTENGLIQGSSSGSGPSVGDGILLEAGTDFVLLETGDYLLQE